MESSCTVRPKNTHFNDGIEAENNVVKELEEVGFTCRKSAGSKSPVDVYAYDEEHKKYGIQVRLRPGAKCSMTNNERQKLINFSQSIGAVPVLAAVCKECNSFVLENVKTKERIHYE
tara:strand:+ start:209 stop:559 length:351 start_codon:yes stop_codon:yes gene_type:complete